MSSTTSPDAAASAFSGSTWTSNPWAKKNYTTQELESASNDWYSQKAASDSYQEPNWWAKLWGAKSNKPEAPTSVEPPKRENYASLTEYAKAMQDWGASNQTAKEMAAYNASNFSNLPSYLPEAAANDVQNARNTVAQNRDLAWNAFQTQTQTNTDRMAGLKQRITDAYGGGIQNRLGEITNSMNESKAVLPQLYNDVLTRVDKISRWRNQALSENRSDEQIALSKYVNDTAAQVDSVRTSLVQDSTQRQQQALAELQQVGYGLDSPQAKTAVAKIRQQSMGQIGELTQKAWTAYNQATLDTRSKFAEMRTSLQSNFASAQASGAATVANAGQTYATTLSDINRWGEAAKSDAINNWQIAQGGIAQFGLAGDQLAQNLLTQSINANQYVPDLPFLTSLFSVDNSVSQQKFQNTLQGIQTALSVLQFGATALNIGGFGKAEAPNSGGGFLGSLGDAAMTTGGTVLMATNAAAPGIAFGAGAGLSALGASRISSRLFK